CRNPGYVEPASMQEYWPPSAAPPSDAAWDESIAAFRRDRDEMKRLADDRTVDLFARIPHGSGQTYLRELVLVADHTAYHVGQMVAVRRALGDWP
ncbi:MAG TPA: DinB family protein, partial [Vicinamibacteria bacterium]|nr:DinB family protein [Vicinamibacteria bacterium]